MKKVFRKSFILLALLGVLFTSCKKDYDVPPIPQLPVGTMYTIGEILNMTPNVPFDTASVCGIVTADEQSGNLYKQIFIQDRATGKAIELMLNTSSAARIGDSVRVFLDKNIVFSYYHNLPQLTGVDGKGFSPDGHLIIYPYNNPIEPATVTIADIKSGNYLAGLVKLDSVEFVETNTTFANVGETTNRTLKDATGECLVRTSNYANFAYDMLPTGKGSLVAIASVYNNDWQLYIRSKNELNFAGGTPNPPAPAGELQNMPYGQSFASDFGTYMTYSVEGDQTWVIDYSTAKMTGYANSTNYVNEDWLISSPVAVKDVANAKVSVSYVAQYQNSNAEDITLQVSSDYVYGNDPTTASWEKLPITFPNTSGWSDFQTVEVSLNDYIGQNVYVAVKFTSTATQSRTMEVQNIVIQEGQAGGGGGGQGGDLQNMPYTQSFATEFGTYTTADVLGPQSWVIDYSTAKMSGYASGTNYANEDWLISSPVAVTGVQNAKASVTYAAQYQNSDSRDVTLQVSTDYVYGDDPTNATWSEMSSTYPNTSNWSDFKTVETSLNDFIGQNVTVAIKYTSTESQSRTIEIQSITVQEGEVGGDTPPTPPTPGTGSGTADDPYNVSSGINLQGQNETAWVQGYIVGAVKDGNTSVSSNDQVNWSAPFDLKTNVLIADDPECREISNCVIVNLPNNKPLRTQVNLVDHPDNLGKQLAVLGTLRTYFGQAGLRDSGGTENDFVLEGGVTPPTPGNNLFSETFASGQGNFVIEDVIMPEELTYVWAHASNFSCMKASAYVGQAYVTESWLVSPAINLADVTTATLSFEQAVNYASPTGALFMMISTDYNGDVTAATWTELSLSAWPTGSDWNFVTSTADLTSYAGQTVNIAFKYTSTTSASATWEVKNVVVSE